MKTNPIVPYILIMVMGLGLIFFLGIKGIGDAKQIAKEAEGGEVVTVEFNPDVLTKTCISCHGENLEGGPAAPSLHGLTLSKEEVADILVHGVPGTAMPGNLVPADHVNELAEWILNLK